MNRTSTHPGKRSSLEWPTAEVWKIQRYRWKQVRQRVRSRKDSSQSPTGRRCWVKFELNLSFMVIYLSFNTKSSSLSSRWKTPQGPTTCVKKENWILVKNNNRFSFYCQSTRTQGEYNEANRIFPVGCGPSTRQVTSDFCTSQICPCTSEVSNSSEVYTESRDRIQDKKQYQGSWQRIRSHRKKLIRTHQWAVPKLDWTYTVHLYKHTTPPVDTKVNS